MRSSTVDSSVPTCSSTDANGTSAICARALVSVPLTAPTSNSASDDSSVPSVSDAAERSRAATDACAEMTSASGAPGSSVPADASSDVTPASAVDTSGGSDGSCAYCRLAMSSWPRVKPPRQNTPGPPAAHSLSSSQVVLCAPAEQRDVPAADVAHGPWSTAPTTQSASLSQ
jgi:hypothetical protein